MANKFLEVQALSSIIEISFQAIYKWVDEGKIEERFLKRKPSRGRRGEKVLINPAGIPEPHRLKWFKHVANEDPDPHFEAIDIELYHELKDYQKEYVDLWLTLFDKFGNLKGKELRAALNIYSRENPDVSCSYPTFKRNEKSYKDYGLVGIIPGWGKRDGETIIKDEDFELFKDLYLKESRTSLESCWGLVRGAAKEAGREITSDFPHPRTFKRRLEKEVPKQVIYYHRHGEAAWDRKYGNHIDRDKSSIPAGSCWVSDHRQLDVQLYSPENDKKFRPWITVWMDFKSMKWLSWHIYEGTPNSDRIFQSFKWGVERFGKPEHIYLDNGKDYRSKDFAGPNTMDDLEKDRRTAIRIMDIKPHFALPYNAKAKNLERSFRNSIGLLEKHLKGYTGKNSVERPTSTKELAPEDAIPKDKFFELVDEFIEEVINRKASEGKEHNGLSPNELFYKEFKTKKAIRPRTLKAFCMRTSKVVTIGKNGANDSSIGQKYWANWMTEYKGQKVYMRRDLKDYLTAWVYDAETDEYLGEAEAVAKINGLIETPVEREELRQKMAENRKEKKIVRDYVELREHPADDIMNWSIMNIDADEEIRKEKGEFLDYDPDDIEVVEMANTTGDEMLKEKDHIDARHNNEDNDIIGGDEPVKPKPLKSPFETDKEYKKRTGTNDE